MKLKPETIAALKSLARSAWATLWASVAVALGTVMLGYAEQLRPILHEVISAYVRAPEISVFVTTFVIGLVVSAGRALMTRYKGQLPPAK